MTSDCRYQVVLLDADDVDILVLRRALERAGFEGEVLEAHSVASALALFATGRASQTQCIVLADITTGRDSAFDLLNALRASHSVTVAPVVVFTASEFPTDRETARALGAAAFVERPVAFADIIQVVRSLLTQWGVAWQKGVRTN